MIRYARSDRGEVLLDYPKIGGEDIKYFVKKAIRDLLHANIDVHSGRLVPEFPGDRVKFISKLQSHCANMNFSEKLGMIDFSRKSHIEEGIQQYIISRYSKIHRLCQFQ